MVYTPFEVVHMLLKFIERAKDNGVTFAMNTEATDIVTNGDRVTGVTTPLRKLKTPLPEMVLSPFNNDRYSIAMFH